MKTVRQILLMLASVGSLSAAETPVPGSTDWGLTGIPTPLEEYGLTIGDVTVSRIFNPVGQLRPEDTVVISRRLTQITNPWQELTPGTGLIVGGKKAVIRQITPDAPPATKQTGLRVKLTVEEIAGTTMTLEWEQQLHNLNAAETAPARAKKVQKLKDQLRVGTHLLLSGNRVIVSKRQIAYNSPTSTANKDLTIAANYYKLIGGRGQLTGTPTGSESITDGAWNLKDGALPLVQNTAQLVTWKFRSLRYVKTNALPPDNDPDRDPGITVLHRIRGVLANLEMPDERTARAEIHATYDGQVHIHQFQWQQRFDNKSRPSWQLSGTQDDFVELQRVHDTNIRFTITPDSLLRANRDALKFFQTRKKNTGALQLSSNTLDPATLEQQINSLKQIVESDASETIKMDAKRQAVIYLARFYEHQAISLQADQQEQQFRAAIKQREAQRYERIAWLNRRKMELLQTKASEPFSTEPEASQPDDLTVPDLSITQIYDELNAYPAQVLALPEAALAQRHTDLLRQTTALERTAQLLRQHATKLIHPETNPAEGEIPEQIARNFALALQFWSEYIHRSEGLMKGQEQLAEKGVIANRPAPDPYIPEILLRQAWIYRQLGQTERAISTNFDVLTATTQQKITNLTRFNRIANLAYSQIANAYYETAELPESYQESIDRFSNMLRGRQEIDHTQVELKLLRSLFKSDNQSRQQIRRLERQLENAKRELAQQQPGTPEAILQRNIFENERKRILGELAIIEKTRSENWTQLKDHATAFINRYAEEQPDLRYDGEVRYYQIMAHKALDNEEHVRRGMEVLLEIESTPEELRQAWFATRVRVVIDVANLLFSEAVKAEIHRTLQPNPDPAAPHALAENLGAAILYYQWALNHDQAYRSQIMLRQQIAFCQERLNEQEAAKKSFEEINELCEMHPSDLNPTLKMVKMLTGFRLENLEKKIQQKRDAKNQPTNLD